MKPEIHLLGLNIKTFGVFFALNFAAWGLLVARRLRELGKPQDWAYEMVLVAIAGGLVGARLYYVIQHYDAVKDHLVSGLFGGAGLVWYGGLLGGTITIVLWARWRGFLNLALLDLAGPGLALGYAVGRIGCQVSGDGDYGIHSGLPWAMAYPHGEVPTTTKVHPTPIYETLSMGLIAFGLWQLRDRVRPGGLFALYLVFAGLERFIVEFVRRNANVALGLTAAQLESLGLLVCGAIWLALILRRGEGLLLGPAARRSALA
jgi:phosphatidylglycerol:prolipoprotein diacylglycerol transferase